eukprot:scaffold97819_cov57-Phaeocystis_antarctica.AAC.5
MRGANFAVTGILPRVPLGDGDVGHVGAVGRKGQVMPVAARHSAMGVDGVLELPRGVRAGLECVEVLAPAALEEELLARE